MQSVPEFVGAPLNESAISMPGVPGDFPFERAEGGFLTMREFVNFLAQSSYYVLLIGIVGVLGNVLIIVTYLKIGLSSSIYVSYFALAVSDLLCVLCNMWMAVCFVPPVTRFLSQYFFVRGMVTVTGAWTCECFTRITAYMTAFISMERCISVLMPLKVSTIFTRRRTSVVITVIYVFNLALASYAFVITRFAKSWSPFTNRTLLSAKMISSPVLDKIYEFVLVFQSFPALMIPLITISVCTAYLSVSLRRSAAWRRSVVWKEQSADTGDEKHDKPAAAGGANKQRNLKELQLAKTVVIVAAVFIVCSSPNAFNVLLTTVVPQYRATGTYGVTSRLVNYLTFALAMVNSSSNFFIYFSTGSVFRRTVKKLFHLAK